MANRDSFDDWAALARQETPPSVDVAHRVARTLQARADALEASYDRQWEWCAAVSAALAAVVAIPAAGALIQLMDPMAGLLSAVGTVMP